MLTVHKCSDTGLFRHLSNFAFCSLELQKQITSESHLAFQSIPNFNVDSGNAEKIEILFFGLEIIAFELLALNTRFH